MKKVNILTLGCAKNLVDSERIKALIEQSGMEYTHDIDLADYLIINTCGFIDSAKQENIDVIMQAAGLRQSGGLKKLVVAGCLSERYKEALSRQIPHVDAFFGVNQFEEIVRELKPDLKKQLKSGRSIMTPGHYAYLKIADGCSHKCSFCAIPRIKGKYASRPMEEILEEAGELISSGVEEIIVIAQDTTYYGMDIYGKRRLPELAEKLSALPDLKWLRIMYVYPVNFPRELIDLMKEKDIICNYIDIPLQHVSERILKSMQRPMKKQDIVSMIKRFRREIPNIAIRSTFITGFPGETKAEHRELCNFLKETKLDRVGVFPYSHEEDTSAYKLRDNIPSDVKAGRLEELMLIQQDVSLRNNSGEIGKTKRVLIDYEKKGSFICRSQTEAPDIDVSIIVNKDKNHKPGDFADVKITRAEHYDLYGKIV